MCFVTLNVRMRARKHSDVELTQPLPRACSWRCALSGDWVAVRLVAAVRAPVLTHRLLLLTHAVWLVFIQFHLTRLAQNSHRIFVSTASPLRSTALLPRDDA